MARSTQRNNRRNRGRRAGRTVPLLIVGAGLLLIVGAAVALLTGGRGTPRLVVEQEVYDYGAVVFETPITTVFTIRNEGNAPLRIVSTPQVEVREGC